MTKPSMLSQTTLDHLYADLRSHLSLSSPVPLYFQLAERLEQAVLDGRLAERSLLPTESELSAAIGCSAWVAKRAVLHLHQLGLVIRRRGVGTLIAPNLSPSPNCWTHEPPFVAGAEVSTVIVEEAIASPTIVDRLCLSSTRRAIRVTRIAAHDGKPVAVLESYLTPDIAVDEGQIVGLGLYSALGLQGLRPVHGVEEYRTRPATARESALLGVQRESWLFTAERTMSASDGRTVEYAVDAYCPERAVVRRRITS
ncbi:MULTISPECIES: GntR family transcriptional regulator [unclassified Microbacterium]|uniref:GntR family transcriptional regulator n=1 Tax=Microbacterium TaxID=33882 RepID=UPI003BA2EC9B